jgi:predicted NAD/FAD-dependent oxidoreductase
LTKIGAGIAGAGMLEYLNNFEDIEVTIFEKESRVSGRMFNKKVGDNTLEMGASFIIK